MTVYSSPYKAIRFSVQSFCLFPVFDSSFDQIPDSVSKNLKAWYRQSFHSKPPNILAYRPGDPGMFHSNSVKRVFLTWS
ncbi:unnamed protein product [Porites lobata]|uniref:Uncharacterized protein n=1 Tax=Porites lobata TaxID=104759 RepID=A0ABN8RSE3_9CNID|nr:unnamed protein product [Porites lobata]